MRYLVLLPVALFTISVQPLAASAENRWHIYTYWAEYIEGHGLGNHALYCGDETIPACDSADTVGGVGPSWLEEVERRSSVADTTVATTVQLTGLMNYDLPDAFWDFVELHVQRGDELDRLARWTGTTDSTVVLDFSAVLQPGEFSGAAGDEVRLVWRVWTSDDGWDDVDSINPSHGACQIDDLSVYVDGSLVTFDDFEPGSPVNWIPLDDGATAVNEAPGVGKVEVAAHPNPFNPRTTISFALPDDAEVSLAVYDQQGRLVRKLLRATLFPAGTHEQAWDGRDDRGRAAASGVHFYRFVADQTRLTGKLTILK